MHCKYSWKLSFQYLVLEKKPIQILFSKSKLFVMTFQNIAQITPKQRNSKNIAYKITFIKSGRVLSNCFTRSSRKAENGTLLGK